MKRHHRLPVGPAKRCLVGMVHLAPLFEGGLSLDAVEAAAVADAEALADAGFDVVMVENFGDQPFYPDRVPSHTVAAMTRVAATITRALAGGRTALGINVLRNDALSALSIAAAVGANAVRVNVHIGAAVTDQGLITGRAHETVRYRDRYAPECAIWADVRVKHAAPLVDRPIGEEAVEARGRGRADALIVSGRHTGDAVDPESLRLVRDALPDCPVLVGSGANPDTVWQLGLLADGFIVGTWLKQDGQLDKPVDPQRAVTMAKAVAAIAPRGLSD